MRMVDNDPSRASWRHLYPDEVVWKICEPYNVRKPRAMIRDFYLTYLEPLWSNSFLLRAAFIVDMDELWTLYTPGVVWSDKGGADLPTFIWVTSMYIVGIRRSQEHPIIFKLFAFVCGCKELPFVAEVSLRPIVSNPLSIQLSIRNLFNVPAHSIFV